MPGLIALNCEIRRNEEEIDDKEEEKTLCEDDLDNEEGDFDSSESDDYDPENCNTTCETSDEITRYHNS